MTFSSLHFICLKLITIFKLTKNYFYILQNFLNLKNIFERINEKYNVDIMNNYYELYLNLTIEKKFLALQIINRENA